MIFQSIVSALVFAAIASAAVITVPKYATTHAPLEYATNKFVESDLDSPITTVKPADTITTVKPADKNATVKPATPAPTQAPMINCYCNLPECLVAAGGDGTCFTRLGCYSEVHPFIPEIEGNLDILNMTPTVTESNKTANSSSVFTTEHAAVIRGSYGCLDQLHFAKQSCEEILKSMEAESSEFPILQIPTNGAAPSAAAIVHAFHCCQTERCNGNQSGPAEGSVKSAQAVLVAALKNSFAPPPGMQNSTVGVPWTPAVKSSVNNVELSNSNTSVNHEELSNANTSVNHEELSNANTSVNNVELSNAKTSVKNVELSNAKTSVNNVELSNAKTSVNNVVLSNTKTSVNNVQPSNAKKNNAAAADLWLGYFSPPLGEPKAPSSLKSDTIFEDASLIDATTPAVPMAMTPKLSVVVPVNQEITHDETVANVEHVVTKRHDSQKVVPVLKQTIDDQENIADFDDDIAAEVAAAVATAKSPVMTTHQDTVSSGSSGSLSDSWSPRHSGVPDFLPPPSLKKNFTTNSILATRGVNNNSNSYNNQADNNDSGSTMIGIICTIVVLCIIGLSLLMMIVLRAIIRNVCSNPGQPCACNGGLTRRRPRTQPSSSHPDAAAAAVNRSASTAPLLPPPNPGHMYRGHANAGASYNDSIGDTTYVFTTIPVPDHVTPVRVVRR
ncbi:uncharacterized protein LOC132936158 isoform X2 [Metopolophium dirhodum]|uniref:uncharacterized protein LOC132936158 isoform X2 n=1 Tax=Metopolophium dirhodum TaxID=44670 RepID=UPI00299074BF|nr:uncharacterized protein LOC132936158 isoform X2 [Metopolophium dirhodum]